MTVATGRPSAIGKAPAEARKACLSLACRTYVRYHQPVESYELEILRRSVAMLPPGHSAGAVSKRQAEDLLAEIDRMDQENDRYRRAVAEVRRVLAVLEGEYRA